LTEKTPTHLLPSNVDLFTEIKTYSVPHIEISLCQFLLNCHNKQDAVKLIFNPDKSILGGILCDGVSESPLSGDFSNFLVENIQSRIISILPQNTSNPLTTSQLEQFLSTLIQEYYQINDSKIKSQEIDPKSTLILYLYFLAIDESSTFSHLFFYIGDGKIVHWDNHSHNPPSELLLEYHNETGALLNAVRKDLSTYTKQYPISKIMLNLPFISDRTDYILFASDGLEPYYEDFIQILQHHPEIEKFLHSQQTERFQTLLLEELFGNLKILPNDDISFILIRFQK